MAVFSYVAVVSDNDGSAFITKAEFDSLKNNFQAQIDNYNQSIDSKIDGAIAAYLAGIKIDSGDEHLAVDWVLDWIDVPVGNFLTGKALHLLTLNASNRIFPGRWIYSGGWTKGGTADLLYKPRGLTFNTDPSCSGTCSSSATSPLTSPTYLVTMNIEKNIIPIMTYVNSYAMIEPVGYSGYPQRRYWVTISYANNNTVYTQYVNFFGSGLTNTTSEGQRVYKIIHDSFDGVFGQHWPIKYEASASSSGSPIDDSRLVWWPILNVEDGSGKINLKYYIFRNAQLEADYYQTYGNIDGPLALSTSKIYFFIKHPDGSTEVVSESTNIVRESYITDQWKVVEVNLRAGDIVGLSTTLAGMTGNIPYYCDLGMNFTNLNP